MYQLRLYLMGNMNSDDYWGNQIQRLIQHGVGGRLTVRSVKLFTDGLVDSLSGFLTLKNPYRCPWFIWRCTPRTCEHS